jgi:hypothetical protein
LIATRVAFAAPASHSVPLAKHVRIALMDLPVLTLEAAARAISFILDHLIIVVMIDREVDVIVDTCIHNNSIRLAVTLKKSIHEIERHKCSSMI